jgi:hypothetical protein
MSAPFFVPFNFQPASTAKGTGTYTCPAGKYALVTISVSGSAYPNSTLTEHALAASSSQGSESFNETLNIWVRSGETVSASLSNASATQSSSGIFTGWLRALSQTTATINHSSSPIAVFRATGYQDAYDSNSTSGNNVTVSVAGNSSFHYYAQEFNELT